MGRCEVLFGLRGSGRSSSDGRVFRVVVVMEGFG